MTGKLVFSQAAADSIGSSLTSAAAELAGIVPATPDAGDVGHPSVVSAVQNLHTGLNTYGGALIVGTQHCFAQVQSASDKLAGFDKALEAAAPAMAVAGKTTPVSRGADPGYAPRFSLNNGGLSTSVSSYVGKNTTSRSTSTNPFGTTMTSSSTTRNGVTNSSQTTSNAYTGTTTTTNTHSDEHGTNVIATKNSGVTGRTSVSVSSVGKDGDGNPQAIKNEATIDRYGNMTVHAPRGNLFDQGGDD
jgi:hypothetical protein